MIKSILETMGYKPEHAGQQWLRMKAIYRNGSSLSLAVNNETGWFQDFVTGQNGPLFKLVMLTLNLGEPEARQYLMGNYLDTRDVIQEDRNKIKQDQYFSSDFCLDLLPSYSFYKNRGISEETLNEFGGGVKTYGKMNNRFVFPIYDFNNKLIGISGRDLYPVSTRPKWKILGKKTNFVYPHHLVEEKIEEKQSVILVESIGDALALYESGIKNFLVLFGLSVSKTVVLYLIRLNVQKIVVATNNDTHSSENSGMKAAKDIKIKLLKFFKEDSVKICLPTKKDFGEMSREEILTWYKNI